MVTSITHNINLLDKLASHYRCEVFLPPVKESLNVLLSLDKAIHRRLLGKELTNFGFIFVFKQIDGKHYYEILGTNE